MVQTTHSAVQTARYRNSGNVVWRRSETARSAGQQLPGHPSSVARPLRPVNLGPRDGAVEQHDKSAIRRFRVLHARRQHTTRAVHLGE